MVKDQIFEGCDQNTDLEFNCGVKEEAFPCLGKCFIKVDYLSSGDVYKLNCNHCKIWTSLPDGASLVVTHIIECSLYGYGRRVKD